MCPDKMAFLNGGESCEQFTALFCAVRIGLELYLVGKIAVIRAIEVLPDNGVAAGKTASLGGFLHNVWILVEKVLGSGYVRRNLIILIGGCVLLRKLNSQGHSPPP